MTASYSTMWRASASAPCFPSACRAGNRECIRGRTCEPLCVKSGQGTFLARTSVRGPERCRVASAARLQRPSSRVRLTAPRRCKAYSPRNLPSRDMKRCSSEDWSMPSNGEWTEIPPGLDASTCRCHRYFSGCVSPLALSAAGRLFEVESANECIEMLPTEPRETLLLVWKLAGGRVANPAQVPIGTPLDLIMVAPCSGLPVAGSPN